MFRKMRKSVVLLTLVSLFTLLLAACGGGKNNNEAASASPSASTSASPSESASAPQRDLEKEGLPKINDKIASKGDVKLEVWMPADWTDKQQVKDLVSEFESVYPNVKVNMSGVTWEDIPNKVRVSVQGGAPADLSMNHPFALGAQGLAEPVDDLWQEWGAESEFLPGSLVDVTWKNIKYGIPLEVNTTFMIYNKEIYQKAGLTEPGDNYTFQQWKDDAKKIVDSKAAPNGMAINLGGWDTYGLIVANGGDLLKFEGDKVTATFNDPKVVEVLQWLHDMAKEKLAPMPGLQARQSDTPEALFANKAVAGFYSGPWHVTQLRNENPDLFKNVGTAAMPNGMTGGTDGSVQGGGSLFIPKGSKNKEVAFELGKWFVSDKYALMFAKDLGRNPARAKLYEDPMFKEDPLNLAFTTQLKTAKPFLLDAYPEAGQVLGDLIREAVLKDDVQGAADRAQAKAQAAIDSVESKK
ncbi:extracellular solute-binding protein [Cohnella luojiensis]|uniref:Extracellular solute-binding protein n=1 Tax=Cohnella luojiensis TaxID=652876 RepID=A0A4Y8LSD3_9BACL|nr:extracellular solute-binding protein [Cohnella luojiensis]TFE24252.1 extracellular solute-binding protein [Cohnella luojiensis]